MNKHEQKWQAVKIKKNLHTSDMYCQSIESWTVLDKREI
jgi:hypothetical protein